MHFPRIAITVAILAATSVTQGVEYDFRTFDVPGAISTRLYGINNHGHIVGAYTDTSRSHGFIFDGTEFRPIAHPGGADTTPLDINDSGTIVGRYGDLLSTTGFVLTNGAFQDVAFPDASWTIAHGINNVGTVVGSFGGPSLSSPTHGFILSGMNYQAATAPDSNTTSLYGINDAGVAVGYTMRSLKTDGFIFDNGDFRPVGFTNSRPTDIDSEGVIAGIEIPPPFGANGMHLGFLIDGESYLQVRFSDATDTFVEGINDSSTLVGSYRDAQGSTHGFYAVVIPEPDALSLFLVAILVLLTCSGTRARPHG